MCAETSTAVVGATSKQSKTMPSESGRIAEFPLDLRPRTGATAVLAGEGGGEPPGRADLEPIPPPWGRAPAIIHALDKVDLSILFIHARLALSREERQSGSGPEVRAAEVGGDARAVEPPCGVREDGGLEAAVSMVRRITFTRTDRAIRAPAPGT